jgi:hypothetical protein
MRLTTLGGQQVYRVDAAQNLILVRGHVPGSKGGVIRVSDAYTQPFPKEPPFPTITLDEIGELTAKEAVMTPTKDNPWVFSDIN